MLSSEMLRWGVIGGGDVIGRSVLFLFERTCLIAMIIRAIMSVISRNMNTYFKIEDIFEPPNN